MDNMMVTACSAFGGFGAVLLIACVLAARSQGGWQPEAEELDHFVMPSEWAAAVGASMMLLAPLLYLAGRARNNGRNF